MPRSTRQQTSTPATSTSSTTGESTSSAGWGNGALLQMLGLGRRTEEEQTGDPPRSGEWRPAPTMDQVRAGAVLEQGHEGAAVTEMQQKLTKLGFGVQASGKLGTTTVGVLQEFQRAYKVQATGKLGPTTVEVLDGALASSVQLEDLMAMMPNLSEDKAREYLPHLNASMYEHGINNDARKAAFLAQVGHESLGLTAFEEFASGAGYEGRRDLGNTQPGDGKRFKGRGPIQLTGRANYRRVGGALGVDLENDPAQAATPEVGFRTAGHFWKEKGLNKLADEGKFDTITKRINGGQNGRADRRQRWGKSKGVLEKRRQSNAAAG